MWFIGLLLGLALGAAVEDIEGAFWGALIGALAGIAIRKIWVSPGDRQLRALEREVERLRESLNEALRRLDLIEKSGPPAPDLGFEIEPAPAPAPRQVTPEPATLSAQPAPDGGPAPASPPASDIAREPPEPALARAEPAQPPLVLRWLLGGNTVVRVGVVVLFFGMAFLLKYAYDHAHLPIEARLIGVAVAALVLLALGWRLRESRPGYALALQGGGVGALYLTVFASLKLFGLLPASLALVLLLLIAALSAALAILQNAQSLAILGVSGGFLAPVLASTGGGSHVMLFGYYAILNAGILAVAWYKAWRPLNLVGFAFTFGIGTLWGSRYYEPGFFRSTEPFLILFFLLYLAIPVLFAARRAVSKLERYADGTLIFGVPLVAFGLQLRLVRGIEFGAAYSALATSLVYLVLARLLWARHREALRLLVESFLPLGVVFATLAIPLALDGRWTAAAWALEGAGILWVGVRQKRLLARVAGMLLQLGAGVAFFHAWNHGYAAVPVLNSFYLGCVFIALGGLFSNWILERHREAVREEERITAVALFGWGLLWWLAGGLHEIADHASHARSPHIALLFLTGTAVVFGVLHRTLVWRLASYPALALPPASALIALADATGFGKAHPLADLGFLAWPLSFAAQYWVLRRHETDQRWFELLHAGTLWLLALVAAWELHWAIEQGAPGVWPLLAWALVPGAVLLTLSLRGARLPWPVAGRLPAYLLLGAGPLAALAWLWIVYANAASNGDPSPLPFVPLLNPLDLVAFAVLLVLALWMRALREHALVGSGPESAAALYGMLGAGAFVAANGGLLRALHHLAGIPYALEPMLRSTLVQAALSIFWSILALAVMVIATRRRLRTLWLVGAGLMGVVVIKLFLVELSRAGSVERIVSFIVVGMLMLLIGYLSPVPPRQAEAGR
jgi:uncharacterized membrane protein